MKHLLVLAVAILFAVNPSTAAGQAAGESAPLRLTLDEAIRRGLSTSHRLAEAAARGEAASAIAAERRAALAPQLAAQGGYTRTNHVETFGVALPNNQFKVIYPDIPNNYRSRLDVQWPIYTAGRLDALERAARAEVDAASSDVDAARADLRFEITRAYWALMTATESVRVVDQSLARVDAHLSDARNQLQAGLIPPNDVLSVEAQQSRQRMLSVQARTARDVAEAELGRLVGADSDVPIEPTSPLQSPPVALNAPARILEEAKRQRPERAALVKRVNAYDERLAAAGAGRKPTVAVAGGVDYGRPNARIFPRQSAWRESWDASVNVNWALFDGGRARAEVAEADALARAARERLAEFDAALAVELRQRTSEIASSQAAIDAGNDAVRSAAEARRVVGDRFAAGVATSTDVLDAQVALLQAELDRTQAIVNARLAEARLTRVMGN